jgi:hypothetical protein
MEAFTYFLFFSLLHVLVGLLIFVGAIFMEWNKGNDIMLDDITSGLRFLILWPIAVYYVTADTIKACLAKTANSRENTGNMIVIKGRRSKRVERILREG